jgi:hypothetical protein
MKHYFQLTLFMLLLFGINTLHAQYIDVRVGYAFAAGSFANNTKDESGFATDGYSTGIGVNYLIHKNIGISTNIQYSNFGLDVSALSEHANKIGPVGSMVTVTSEHKYIATSAIVGPYITLGKRNLTVDLRLLIGFLSLSTPQLLYYTTYNGSTYTQLKESSHDVAAAISYGVTAKYAFPKNIYCSLHIDNIKANTTFAKNGYQSSNTETITKPYQANLITVGVGYAIQ